MSERLEHDAVAFGEADERLDLPGGSLGVQVEGQADRREPDWRVLADGQGAAEVQITLGGDGSSGHVDPQRGGHRPQRDARKVTTACSGCPGGRPHGRFKIIK